jgi:hypothetical protein
LKESVESQLKSLDSKFVPSKKDASVDADKAAPVAIESLVGEVTKTTTETFSPSMMKSVASSHPSNVSTSTVKVVKKKKLANGKRVKENATKTDLKKKRRT